ncbi:MAG: hypothetical protein OHK0040_12260 [bacterium]
MNKSGLSTEFKVGIFVIIGCFILIFMSMKVGGFKFFKGVKTYDVVVYFDSVEGLDVGGAVQIAGVTVGRVKEIKLEGDKAKVILEINEGVVVKKDASASIKTKGVLGEKFVEVMPGTAEEVLQSGGKISSVKKTMDLDTLVAHVDSVIGDVKEVTVNLKKTLGGEEGEAILRGIFNNLYELSVNLNSMVKKNDEGLSNTVKNLEKFSATLAEKTPELSEDLKELSKTLKDMMNENRGNLKDSLAKVKDASEKLDKTLASLQSVSEKIDKGEGTLGKLINDDSAHENLNKTLTGLNKMIAKSESIRTYFDFRSEYLERLKDSRSQVNLKIYPKSDYFYMIGGVDSPMGKLKRETQKVVSPTGTTVTTTETEKEKTVLINAQIGKRFHNVEFRGGLFESTGGFGFDYYSKNDKWKYTMEAYNFDREYAPHLKFAANYNLYKYLFFTGGVDDVISDRHRRSVFLGAGIKFEDEDIKYLLSSAPLPTK